ncbi:MAG: lysylphosphatidylglycerol synthase domain-containing protein [Acidimicrobiia bacterium]
MSTKDASADASRTARLLRRASLGRSAFARASEEPYRRRPADALLAATALAVLVAAAFHEGDASPFELDLVRTLGNLPSDLHGLFVALFHVGALWAVVLVSVAALVARRFRLARDLILAGVVAWALARLIGFVVGGSATADAFRSVVSHEISPRFPTVSVAVLVAVVVAAAPYLTRAVRWLGAIVVVLALPGAVAIGAGYPNDVVAGVAVGVLVAAGIHLAFGSPGGRPTTAQIELALADLGVDADDVALAPVQPLGRTAVTAVTASGPVDVTVLGRDERDARTLAKAFRFAVYRDSGPARFRSRLQEVEHEGFVLLLTARAGARVPELLATGVAGPDAAVVVTRAVDGPRLASRAAQLSDAELDATWDQVARLHAARVAHGCLDVDHVVLAADGPTIVDFVAASSSAAESRLGADVATLLVTTAATVGPDRAIASARRGLGDDALLAALPFVQPGVLPRRSRALVPDPGKTVPALRDIVAAELGVETPEVQELRRVTPGTVLTYAMTAFGVWALLGVIGDPAELWRQIKDANFWFVILGFALWATTNLTYAVSALGGLPPDADVPLGPLTMVQSAGSFLNLATPGGIGTMLMNIRFLQKRGVPAPTAIASGTLPTIGYTIVQFGMLAVTARAVAGKVSLEDLGIRSGSGSDSGGHDVGLAAVIVVAVALVAGIVLLVPRLRAKVTPPIVTTVRNVWSVLTSPRKLLLIVGGSLGTQLINALILAAALAAFDQHVPLAQLLFVNTAVSLFASVIPVPGGMGVTEAGLTAGLAALGVDPSIATAAVLTDRLVTAYIPPVIGWVSLRSLQRRGLV